MKNNILVRKNSGKHIKFLNMFIYFFFENPSRAPPKCLRNKFIFENGGKINMIGDAKRRKSKYNPYKRINIDEKEYIINFKDIENIEHNVNVSKEIFLEFNKFELKDISEMNEFDRHIEHSEINEYTLNKRMLKKEKNLEEDIIKSLQYKELYEALLRLPKKQYKRVTMYFFKELNQKEIAKKEKCSTRAIQYSIKIALKNLKKYLNETS